MTYSKLRLPRIPDAVAHQLETRIIEGSLKPGDRLPAERELALELGVSRPSLREAIKQLVSRGLLLSRHGGGTFVTDRLTTSFSDPWQQLLAQHPFLHDDVLEFRHLLEASAASLAHSGRRTAICNVSNRRTSASTRRTPAATAAHRWLPTSPST
jgi:GntR family transcriptional repressor for pyruvate dehydrogenase complex